MQIYQAGQRDTGFNLLYSPLQSPVTPGKVVSISFMWCGCSAMQPSQSHKGSSCYWVKHSHFFFEKWLSYFCSSFQNKCSACSRNSAWEISAQIIKEWWSNKLLKTDGVWHKKLQMPSYIAFILSKHLYRNTYSNVQYHSAEYLFLLPSVLRLSGCNTDWSSRNVLPSS